MATTNNDWQTYKLGELCDIKTGKKDVNAEDVNGAYPFFTCAQDVHKINTYTFDTEAVLVAGNGFFNVKYYKGKFDVYQRTYVLHNFSKNVDGKFIYHFVNSKLDEITQNNRGSTIRYIRLGDLTEQEVLLPSIDEQRRITAKLEELLQAVKKSSISIISAKQRISKFRQAVLSAAVTGKLTEGWREKNLDRQSAQEIISRIYERRLKQARTAAIKKKITYLYSVREDNDSENLPEGWKYTSLNKLCESFEYGSSKKSCIQGRVAVLRMGNLQNGEIDWSNLVFTSDKDEIAKYQLKPNTVLFNRTNSPELVGKTSIYRGERPAIFAGYLIRINNYPELDSEYLNIYLNSYLAREFCRQVKTDGVSQSNINAQKLGGFEMPLCSIEEQKEIVKRVKSLLTVADEIEDKVNKAAARVEKLTQSILGKAFKGELIN